MERNEIGGGSRIPPAPAQRQGKPRLRAEMTAADKRRRKRKVLSRTAVCRESRDAHQEKAWMEHHHTSAPAPPEADRIVVASNAPQMPTMTPSLL